MLKQNPEATAFLARIASLPKSRGILLDPALQPSLDDEAELRRLFATDKSNARLKDPFVGLVDVFAAPDNIRTIHARVIDDIEYSSAHYAFPLADVDRRKEGTPSMVENMDYFLKNWAIFTEGSLSQIDWSNVIVAGGAVQACLSPLPEAAPSKRELRRLFHTLAYPASDVDLFLYGLTQEQAEVKMQEIYNAIQDTIPWDVTCIRTKHTVSIHSQYPYRTIQIILRLYSSPAEILTGFDVDAPCFAFDGQRIWGNPRAIVAMMRQCNTVDVSRRSPSYEVRLAKYAKRGFEVYIPSLRRQDVDPTIYERSIFHMEGLARLLVLERLIKVEDHDVFIASRRALRGRPEREWRPPRQRRMHGDLKVEDEIDGLVMNDYDVLSLHIPYGPGWHARRIDKLIYRTDLGMNSTFNPKNKNRKLHRHVAFFGTATECLQDCCRYCPEPNDATEKELQKKEDESYIRGPVEFIKENPGRQSITGSFRPIDVGEWAEQAYIGATEKFFTAIATHDHASVIEMMNAGHDVNRRDHVGRTALQVAILSRASSIAIDLIEAGARLTARLVDGRNSLHLAAQTGQVEVVIKIIDQSTVNEEREKEKKDMEEQQKSGPDKASTEDVEMASDKGDQEAEEEDEDDWSEINSDEANEEKAENPQLATDGIPEDAENSPDIIDINTADWDFGFTPLCYAVLSGSVATVDEFLLRGADVKLISKANDKRRIYPLAATLLREDDEETSVVAERLLKAKASSVSVTDKDHLYTVLHRAVLANKHKLVTTLLEADPNASTTIKFPAFVEHNTEILFPVLTAIMKRHYAMLATLLAHGAKLVFSKDDIQRGFEARTKLVKDWFSVPDEPASAVYQPLETAIANFDDVFHLLIALDAQHNIGIKAGLDEFSESVNRKSIIDWVNWALKEISEETDKAANRKSNSQAKKTQKSTWKEYTSVQFEQCRLLEKRGKNCGDKEGEDEERQKYLQDIKEYLQEIKTVLVTKKAKTWAQIKPKRKNKDDDEEEEEEKEEDYTPRYIHIKTHNRIPQRLNAAYDELFEAAYKGDDENVQKLCSKDSSEKSGPLSLSVDYESRGLSGYGFTAFDAAVLGRNWSTAKLLLDIAVGQYKPKEKTNKFSTGGIKLNKVDEDETSDEEDSDEGSDLSMSTDESESAIDITKDVLADLSQNKPASYLLNDHTPTWVHGGDQKDVNALTRAVLTRDFEGFTQIIELYVGLPEVEPIILDFNKLIKRIMCEDHVEMLDRVIRWAGVGIVVKLPKENVSERDTEELLAENKLYLGLDVSGKKRIDLARKHDPDAILNEHEEPLLWRACRYGAVNIIQYLGGNRPLEAYHFYASAYPNEPTGKQLKKVVDLKSVLPEWLGWRIDNVSGDSPLIAGILGRKSATVKILFEQDKKLMEKALGIRVIHYGFTPLLLAAACGADVDLVDFLLTKQPDLLAVDKLERRNIYHLVSERRNTKLLEHFLDKLPRHVNESLFVQQTKKGSTPLHISVQQGDLSATKLITDHTKLALLTRDVSGSTPIHLAVSGGFYRIAQLLIEASPPEALYMENGVGSTPLEIAQVHHIRRGLASVNEHPQKLYADMAIRYNFNRYDAEKLEAELPKFRQVVQELLDSGKLKKKSKVTTELSKFANVLEHNLEVAMARRASKEDAEKVKEVRPDIQTSEPAKVLLYIQERLVSHTGERQLVHLLDVQRSVHADLPELGKPRKQKIVSGAHDDLHAEGEDVDKKSRSDSLVMSHLK